MEKVQGVPGASVNYGEEKKLTRSMIFKTDSLATFERQYSIDKILEGTEKGASLSVMAFGHVNNSGKKIVIKISCDVEDWDTTYGTVYENFMYKTMYYDFRNRMPGFISWVDTFNVSKDDFLKHTTTNIAYTKLYAKVNALIKELQKIVKEHYPPDFYFKLNWISFNITEMADGFVSVDKYIQNLKEQSSARDIEKRMRDLVFQIVFYLHVMVMRGYQHNDLHTNNILINGSKELNMDFRAEGKDFHIDKCHPIALFDWDFGSAKSLGINHYLQIGCERNGTCNAQNARFDLYTILRMIAIAADFWKVALPDSFKKFMYEVILNIEQHQAKEKFTGRLCNLQKKPYEHCIPYPEDQPASILVPKMAILLSYFSELSINAAEGGARKTRLA